MAVPIPLIASTLPSIVSAVTQGGPRRQYKWNKRMAELQNEMNRKNAAEQFARERQLQQEAREYDSPGAQMKRFIEAGLNPHMIYGGGSGSAGQAFPIHAPQMPGVNVGAVDASFPDVVSPFLAAYQAQASVGLTHARTDESIQRQALLDVQKRIAETNPMLSPSVAMWVSNSMEEAARLKTLESRTWLARDQGTDVLKVTQRVNAELDAAMQRVGLNTTDLAIKNKILESKEFENMIKELQAKWLKDAEVTPEHFRQALMLILGKMVGR